jgi:hypothetical protein
MADARFSGCTRRDVFEPNAIEDILTGRQIVERELGREVAIGQRIGGCGAENGLETFNGRGFDAHARRPVGARPHHCRAGIDIAGLDAAQDLWSVGGAAEIGLCENARAGERKRGCGSDQQFAPGQSRPAQRHSGDLHRITMKGARRI